MTEQPSGDNVAVNVGGFGDIDMWTGPTRAVGRAVDSIGQDLGSAIPVLLDKIASCHESISGNISTLDELSRKYQEQENEGYAEFLARVNGFPERISNDAASCFVSVDLYLANDADMARRMYEVANALAARYPRG